MRPAGLATQLANDGEPWLRSPGDADARAGPAVVTRHAGGFGSRVGR